jgi:hypothetical protein
MFTPVFALTYFAIWLAVGLIGGLVVVAVTS